MMPNGRRLAHRSLLAALVLATLVSLPFPRVSSAEGEVPAGTPVSALGRIEPDDGVILVGVPSTPEAVNGPLVTKVHVKAGDEVTQGQLLAETDITALEAANVRLAKAELQLAESEAEAAIGREQDACSRAEVARRTSVRRNNLHKSGVTSDEEADIAAGDAKALSGACNAAHMAAKAASAGVEVAKARVARVEVAFERSRIRAPFDGRVLRIVAHEGELVQAQGLLRMGKISRMFAIAEVYETDIGRVKKGQKATITSPALPGPLTGVVDHLRLEVRKQDVTGTDPAARKDARIVEVEVLLDQPQAVASLTHLQVEVLLHP
jgi:HlyD family secretion protein